MQKDSLEGAITKEIRFSGRLQTGCKESEKPALWPRLTSVVISIRDMMYSR
jgi:hypothetical protein